jgi:FSR family fosmidomycin resistance protein-like MFS transporter
VFGIREAAWPLIRRELSLSYLQVGLLLSVPGIVGTFVEPGLALLSDAGRRRRIVLGGGALFILALIAFAAASGFTVLLAASCLFYPASGAFVSLAQATWMDLEPAATERNMSRWVLAGSVGDVVGPLLLGVAVAVGWGWREATLAAALVTVPTLLAARRLRYPEPHPEVTDLRAALRGATRALRSRSVLRWLTLLQLTDLLQDVFLGYLALYLVDVAGASPQLAGVGLAVWTVSALLGDALLLRVLRRLDGLRFLRWSAAVVLLAYPAFLAGGSPVAKIALLVPIAVLRSGWYAIPQGRLYAELPARGGTAVAIGAPADLWARSSRSASGSPPPDSGWTWRCGCCSPLRPRCSCWCRGGTGELHGLPGFHDRVILRLRPCLRRAARRAQAAPRVREPFGVHRGELLPFTRHVVLGEDRRDGADRNAGVAVHALVGLDVEHPGTFVDAVDGTLVHAGLVLDVDAGLGDHVRHVITPSPEPLPERLSR